MAGVRALQEHAVQADQELNVRFRIDEEPSRLAYHMRVRCRIGDREFGYGMIVDRRNMVKKDYWQYVMNEFVRQATNAFRRTYDRVTAQDQGPGISQVH